MGGSTNAAACRASKPSVSTKEEFGFMGESSMSQDDVVVYMKKPISPELELAVLHFWAAALQMERNFTQQEIAAIPELARVIEMAQALPSAIGWDDVLSKYTLEAVS
jgi:hypothetical protein